MSESLDKATPLELDMLILQKKISQGDFENIEFLLDYFENFNDDLSKKTLNSHLKSVSNQ